MYAIDVEPIPPRNRNNREVHLDYLKHLKESVETLREIVEEARIEKPLDNTLKNACFYTKRSQELLEYVIGTCPKEFSKRDKKQPEHVSTSEIVITERFSNTSEKPLTRYKHRNKKEKAISSGIPTTAETQTIDASVVQIIFWYLDSGCLKNMTGNSSRLRNFVKKFIGTVRFGNDHFGAIMGYGDYVIGDSMISRVYYVEGLGHNLFSVGQFYDSDLEVAFRKHSCYVRDVDGVDLLKGKSKKYTHKPKSKNTIIEVLHTLHMDLCGPIRVHNINGKKYILVIVDDYSRFTWVKFLRSKDETLEFVIKFLNQIQVGLNKNDRYIQTDNGTEFVNQVLTEFYESVSIFHQKFVPRTPRQNDIVERQNCTLVEAARTMLIFFKALMFLWAEAVATAFFGALCYPINDSEDLRKLKATDDIGIFVSYAPNKK
ncbi:integrase, catalytic region, zinc finger, CCHC-type containing protein, partial [Tanacetum coccineum]